MKVEKKWNPSIFLATYLRTYHKNMAIIKKKSPKNLQNLANLSFKILEPDWYTVILFSFDST
jgi:hypothetical protein